MDAVILCGGRGTRLAGDVPKPLVEVGGRPIVWHVVRLLAAQGIRRFLLATGHRGDEVAAFVAAERWPAVVESVDTGDDTPSGGRVHRLAGRLSETFVLAYADGVADLDLAALRAHHSGLATMTVVRPRLPFGVARLDGDDRVAAFEEKPVADHWVNGGFFVFEPGALAYLREDSVLEREPLSRLAAHGRLGAYRHTGFWACLDTHKDAVALEDLWRAGRAPWRLWA